MRSCRFAGILPILVAISALAQAQGTTPSATDLQQLTGSGGQSGFFVTVRPGVENPTPSATGTVTLYDGTTAIGSPVTLSWGGFAPPSTFAQVYGTPDPAVATAASGALWADFNGDGRPDLLVYGSVPGTSGQPELVVQTFLSNIPPVIPGTANFTPVAAQHLALTVLAQYGQALAVLDVDGDGKLDLLAGNTVAYGNGDGTFGRVAVLPILASGYSQTYAVDIDGDGKADIVAVDTPPSPNAPGTVQYAFTVFHNNGDGSFTKMGPYPLAAPFAAGSSGIYNIFGLSFADVNGDGRMDVLSQSNVVPLGNAEEPAKLNIMVNLGNGFSAPKPIDTSTILDEGMVSTSFAGPILTDLNNDGKQDLVFSYQTNELGNNGVATLLGNGDGTFAAPVNYTIGNTLTVGSPLLPLITEDVNSFGNTDVVLGSGVLLLGNGDGTLTAGTPLFTSTVAPVTAPPAYALLGQQPQVSGTVYGQDITFINLQPGANAVFFPYPGSVATLTPALAPGAHSLTAHYSGDANYAASVSTPLNVTIPPSVSTVTLTSSANPSYSGEIVTFTATITGFPSNALGGTASVTFSDGTTVLGTSNASSGVATITTSFSTAGSHTITAAYSGDANNAASSATITQTVDAPLTVGSGSGGSTSLTVMSGQSVKTPVAVSGAGGFSGTVSFSCTGLPANAACSFSPASGTVSGTTAATTTMTVSTAATTMAGARDGESFRSMTVLACGLPLFGFLVLLPATRGRRLWLFIGGMLFASTACLTGCGGSSSNGNKTPPGSYTFQVVATSGNVSSTADYKLTVQ